MQRNTALRIAKGIVEKLEPFCTAIDIAGSCRRKAKDVKDITIIAIPKADITIEGEVRQSGPIFTLSSLHWKALHEALKLEFGDNDQIRYKMIEGVQIEFSMPKESDYYRVLAISTGSPLFATEVIAAAWKRKGWCETTEGLRMKIQCSYNRSSRTWNCVRRNPELPPVWKSEKEFFEWLGIRWIKPELRG